MGTLKVLPRLPLMHGLGSLDMTESERILKKVTEEFLKLSKQRLELLLPSKREAIEKRLAVLEISLKTNSDPTKLREYARELVRLADHIVTFQDSDDLIKY